VFERTIGNKIKNVLGKYETGLGRGKETGDTTGMLGYNTKQLDTDEEFCECLIDWQNVFDHVNWAKLMQVSTGEKEGCSADCAWMGVLKCGWTKGR